MRCPVTFKYGIKAQTAATYLNLPSYPPLPPLSHRKDIQRERTGKGLSQQVRPRVGSDPLSEQWFWEVWHLTCPRVPPSVGTATGNLGKGWAQSAKLEYLPLNFGTMGLCKWNRMLSGAFLDLSDPFASKFYFLAVLESIKKVWVIPEFTERAAAVKMLAKNWDVQGWWPKMGSTAYSPKSASS